MQSKITVSDKGVLFITQPGFDSFVAKPYKDSGGLWTVGFGQRITPTQASAWADGITIEQGRQLLASYLVKECAQLSLLPLSGLMQHQQDALVSLAYNVGITYLVNQTTVYKRLVIRALDLSPWLWLVRDAAGIKRDGLVKRREAELRLFIYGEY